MTEQRSKAENDAAEDMADRLWHLLRLSGAPADKPIWDGADQQYLVDVTWHGVPLSVAVIAKVED